jgi:hypothetical protein
VKAISWYAQCDDSASTVAHVFEMRNVMAKHQLLHLLLLCTPKCPKQALSKIISVQLTTFNITTFACNMIMVTNASFVTQGIGNLNTIGHESPMFLDRSPP